jgi:hypothetical protein
VEGVTASTDVLEGEETSMRERWASIMLRVKYYEHNSLHQHVTMIQVLDHNLLREAWYPALAPTRSGGSTCELTQEG